MSRLSCPYFTKIWTLKKGKIKHWTISTKMFLGLIKLPVHLILDSRTSCSCSWPQPTSLALIKAQIKMQTWTEEASSALFWGYQVGDLETVRHRTLHLHSPVLYQFLHIYRNLEKTNQGVPQSKPWFNNRVRELFWVRDTALKSQDSEEYSRARRVPYTSV